MGEMQLRGSFRGEVKRTTIPDPAAKRPEGLVQRQLAPLALDQAVGRRHHLRLHLG
ncbi:hypothetical protein LWP59_08790 [Amycolatopsis acidiphila]|uniref:hypothetical protein n=1 Tax=Amycolatopsis acidiphila TaxID=715473 RepID=UPI001643CEA4|nr:hypothetical protein [Amycolatopsis acidiphila]UIJ61701.1 hypothetical protein LWP59_08790 [Amycolatopsis acidiphila]GHG58335.1 hypothetical protein GCM10017788_10910 [Amycolatopsis acidiphila]